MATMPQMSRALIAPSLSAGLVSAADVEPNPKPILWHHQALIYQREVAVGVQPLWDLQLGAAIRSPPVSFMIDGKQQIAVSAGSSMFVFGN
jgi:hypothetical protein